MLVGQIAWEHTRPAVRDKVTVLVRTLEATYNSDRPYNFVTAGCWMDDMRSKPGYAWSKWHYVNIPWTADGAAFALPEPPHVVWAIQNALQTLKGRDRTPEQRAEALAMFIHFVGDVHQPLHATDRDDRGGNGVLIAGVPFTDLWPGTVANLHAFWDKGFRFGPLAERVVELWQCPPMPDRPQSATEGIIKEEAAKIMARFPPASLATLIDQIDPTEWARESHALGCRAGYPPGAQPSDHEVVTITPPFAKASQEIAAQRVAVAGYRLAKLLHACFEEE